MGQIVSLVARKGGVGKTTLAANLAGEFASGGAEVRLLDADPQKSLSIWASMGSGFLSSRVTAVASNNEKDFEDAVTTLQAQSDILIIDTPPGFAEPALFAAKASELVLVPCGASPLDLAAARDAISLCRQIRKHRRTDEPAIGLVPSRYLQNSGLGRDLAGALAHLGERTLPGVTQRVALAEAAISGLTIREFAPNSAAHREIRELANAVRSYLGEKRNQTTQAQAVGIR
jgi:chromosome partitioning protein